MLRTGSPPDIARPLAAARWQGDAGMQGKPVEAVGRLQTVEAIQGVTVQSETTRAGVSITDVIVTTDVAAANAAADASHLFAAIDAADMRAGAKTSLAETYARETSTAEASDATAAAESSAARTFGVSSAAAHMAAATEAAAKPSAMTTTSTAATARVGCACEQAGSEKGCRQYRDHPFHHDTPFRSDCSAP